MTLRDILQQNVDMWERLGHPALLERFVLRNGKDYQPAKRIGRKGEAKACFSNSHIFMLKHGGSYVEGYTVVPDMNFPVHHAWVTMTGEDAMDKTLDAAGREYIGIKFDKAFVVKETARHDRYGMLDTGIGLNWRLMFEIDPELREIVERVSGRKLRSAS